MLDTSSQTVSSLLRNSARNRSILGGSRYEQVDEHHAPIILSIGVFSTDAVNSTMR